MAAREASDYKRVEGLAAQLAQKAQQQGARYVVSKALQFRCAALRNLGDPKDAIAVCQQAYAISTEITDHGGEAAAMNATANALYDQGDLAGARKMYEQAAAIYRSIGNKGGLAGATDNAANVVSDQGDFTLCPEDVRTGSVAIPRGRRPDRHRETLNNSRPRWCRLATWPRAEKNFQAALEIWRTMGSPSGAATALTNLGDMRMGWARSPGPGALTRNLWKRSARTAR